MVVSVHVADVGLKGPLVRAPKPKSTPGLIKANAGLCAALGPGLIPRADPRRVGMVAFWDDQASLDAFMASSPVAETFSTGWTAALEPIRAFGTWPGLASDVPRNRNVDSDGPVVVTTLARSKMTRLPKFLVTTAKAEERVVKSPGLLWSTGMGFPPFFATVSTWDSAQAAKDYAYGGGDAPEHPDAIEVDRAKAFHHQSAFIRFRPLSVSGTIDGMHPIDPVSVT